MTLEQSRLADYLGHILEAIARIGRYTDGIDESEFLHSDLVQDGVIRNLEVVGEASHNIATRFPEFALANPELPFAIAYQMRNAVAHGYFKVDLEIVWKTVKKDLPALSAQVQESLRKLQRDSGP